MSDINYANMVRKARVNARLARTDAATAHAEGNTFLVERALRRARKNLVAAKAWSEAAPQDYAERALIERHLAGCEESVIEISRLFSALSPSTLCTQCYKSTCTGH